jgi:hypothetical protein
MKVMEMRGGFIGGIAAAMMIAISGQALGQDINPEIANCEELRDDATVTQAEICKAHIGCAFVFKIQKVCAKAKGFLNRLADTLSGRREVTNNDVFEANTPPLLPSTVMNGNAGAARHVVKSGAEGGKVEKETAKAQNGNRVYYEGTKANGHFNGTGVYINESGAMGRGQMKDNRLEGVGQTVSATGQVVGGVYREGVANGPVALQTADGSTVLTGTMVDGSFRGWVDAARRDGYTQKGFVDDQGRVTRGEWAPPGQVAVAPQIPTTPAQVAPAPKPSPTAAIDARISQQRASCEAEDGGCRKVCIGLGAVSIFSALRGADTTSQVTECSNRCDGRKAECDGKVAALESEKQALLQPRPAPAPVAPGTPGVGGPSEVSANCQADESLLRELAESHSAFNRQTNNRAQPTTEEYRKWWHEQVRFDSGQSIEENQRKLAEAKRLSGLPRISNYEVTDRYARAKAAYDNARLGCVVAAQQAAAGRAAAAPGRTGLPFEECQRLENSSDVAAKLNRIPGSDTVMKTRGLVAASDFMISNYRQCLPDQRAQQMVAQYQRVRADSLRTCRESSGNPGICERSPF